MKSCSDETESAKMREGENLKVKVQCGNSWYVADQFGQLDKSGTRFVIELRWKCFRDIFLHYLENRVSHDTVGPLRYLDAGCGDGINLQWMSGFFQEQHIDIRVTALDYNPLRIDRVKKRHLAEEAHVASLLGMPFNDSTFDMVLCSHVLEHMEKYPQALVEIFRVLKPGGLVVIGVPNEGCFLAQLRNRVIQRSILRKTDHVIFFKSEILVKALRSSGFNVVRIYREGFFLPHSWAHYALSYFALGRWML